MANLLNQPKEIILEQCKELDDLSLSNLIKTNRRFHEICNRVLHERKLDKELLDTVHATINGGFFDIFQYYKPLPENVISVFKDVADSEIVIRQYVNGNAEPVLGTVSPKMKLIYQSVRGPDYYIYKIENKEFNLDFKLKIVEYLDIYGGGDYYDVFLKYIFFPGNILTSSEMNPFGMYEVYIMVDANPTTVKYRIGNHGWPDINGTRTLPNDNKKIHFLMNLTGDVLELNEIPLDEIEMDILKNLM